MNDESRNQESKLTRVPSVPIPSDTPWLTSEQAACYLQVSLGQLYNLVSQRRLSTYKATSRHRFHKKDLDEFIQAGFRPAAPPVLVSSRHG